VEFKNSQQSAPLQAGFAGEFDITQTSPQFRMAFLIAALTSFSQM
jgi:hypothetical protein